MRRPATISGVPVEPLYSHVERDLAKPGEFPYTRGIHPGDVPREALDDAAVLGLRHAGRNESALPLFAAQGQTGLSVAFDLPTLMGYDADHALSRRRGGQVRRFDLVARRHGDSLRWNSAGRCPVSMTINSPAAVLWAMYLVVAEQQGVAWQQISGTLQNDILKEYIAQKEYIFPPRPSMRLVTDTIEFGARHTPKFNPISISGYHIREAGSTAASELAFTLRDGIDMWIGRLNAAWTIDDFARRLSFFLMLIATSSRRSRSTGLHGRCGRIRARALWGQI